jgi:hypothetical protein
VILFLIVVVSKIVADWWNQPILIDPLIVPKTMEEQGYTGAAAANRLRDETLQIEQTAQTIARRNKFAVTDSEVLPDFEIPETKISLVLAIDFLEESLGVAPPHVRAELIFQSAADWPEAAVSDPATMRVVIFARISGAKGSSRWDPVTVKSPDEAMTRLARDVVEMTNPYLLPVYDEDIDHDHKAALRLIQEALALDHKNAAAYNGWGYVLDAEHDYRGAIEKYQQALALDSKNERWC